MWSEPDKTFELRPYEIKTVIQIKLNKLNKILSQEQKLAATFSKNNWKYADSASAYYPQFQIFDPAQFYPSWNLHT